MKKISLKLICCLASILCSSLSIKAQLPIKNSVLTVGWKLISINDQYNDYSYDCEKKKFHMDDKMYFMLGEVEADIFEKDIIKKAEKSFFKVNTNGNYELAFGTNSIEKGIWKSKAIKESEEGFIPNRFGYLVLTSGSETFDALVRIEGQQLLLTISTRSEESLSTKEFTFRKDFKGDAFK